MKVGLFELDVTPPVGCYLAGYPSRNEPSQGVDDPLYLRIVALDDEQGGRWALVTADLLKFPRDMAWRLKTWAAETLGLPGPALTINLSHTHAAPNLFIQRCYPHWPLAVDYVRELEQHIRNGIRAALEELRPATVRYGLHQAHFGINRRLPKPELGGRVVMAQNPDGYHDPDLPVFTVSDADGLRAILYSYACHPTSKNALNLSADWPGQVSQALKRELGDQVVTLYAQATAGSIGPGCHQRDGEEVYRAYWAEVAAGIAAFARSDAMREVQPQIDIAETEFDLPYDTSRLPTHEQLMAFADPAETPVPDEVRPANRSLLRLWARDMLEWTRLGTVPEAFRMHLGRIKLTDDLHLLTLSGEVTAEVGRMIKDLFPPGSTMVLGYCSYTDAYIPTAAMLPQGGHEALGSIYFHDRPAPFTPDIDDILKNTVQSFVGG